MEIVNKIQIRLDSIKTSASTISIPFGLDFFPVDNSELQEVEFVDKEIERAINPIFDDEKYPFYPTYVDNAQTLMAYNVNFVILNQNLSFLGLTDDDIIYRRNSFRRTYLRLNFYDSRDTKIQNLVARETIHLELDPNWFDSDQKIKDQTTLPLIFKTNFKELIYNSSNGEGYNFYWYKQNLPKTLYVKASIMNAKTGRVENLYSSTVNPTTLFPGQVLSLPVAIVSGGFNYIRCDFYEELTKKQQFYYTLNSDSLCDVSNTGTPTSIANSITNTIIINLQTY
jgi:hypothetical protein